MSEEKKIIHKEVTEMLIIVETIRDLGSVKIFQLKSGYWQTPIDDASKLITASARLMKAISSLS